MDEWMDVNGVYIHTNLSNRHTRRSLSAMPVLLFVCSVHLYIVNGTFHSVISCRILRQSSKSRHIRIMINYVAGECEQCHKSQAEPKNRCQIFCLWPLRKLHKMVLEECFINVTTIVAERYKLTFASEQQCLGTEECTKQTSNDGLVRGIHSIYLRIC